MTKMGIIKPMEGPTDYNSGMVIVRKLDGKVPISVDLNELNKFAAIVYQQENTFSDSLLQYGIFRRSTPIPAFRQFHLAEEPQALATCIALFGRLKF